MKQNGKKPALVPRYMQIREKLLARLNSEEPECPECLPKEEELCRLYRVSRSTIAKALDGLVEQGLVRRIKRKGTVINHRKLQSLRRKKSTQEISVVFPLTNYWQKALKAMFDEAGKQGFALTILPYDWHSLDSETEAVEKALRNSCGLILYPGAHRKDKPLIESVDGQKFPVVLFDLYYDSCAVGCVVEDNFLGGYKATESLIQSGRRRIGFISWGMKGSSSIARAAGYSAALRDYELPREEELFLNLNGVFEPERLRTYFERQKPDAVFVTSHMEALQIRHFLQKTGKRVPKDVKLAKFDSFPGEELTAGGINAVVQPEEEMGRQAIRQLCERIRTPEVPHRKTFLVPDVIIRS